MGIKIRLIPYEKFKRDNFKAFLKHLKDDTIVLVDAKLTPQEEAYLIQETMEEISERFSGIELSSLDITEKELSAMNKIRSSIAERISGKKRGMTIIGPASIVKQIKKNPEELLLYM